MAVKRGLNKGRGLGSLIPNKIGTDDKENNSAGNEESKDTAETVKSEETAKKPVGKTTAAKSSGRTSGKSASTASAKKSSDSADKTADAAMKKTASKGKASAKTENKIPEEGNAVLRISQVVPNQDQPRKAFDEESIDELASSIKEYGVIQPLLVQKKGRYYEIIAGERRWRAAKKAGIKEVPVIIGKYEEQEIREISLIENIQREDLNAIEEAEAYKALMDEFSLTQEEVAQKVGKKRSTVTNALRLLKLAAPVRHLLVKGDISMGHARALLALEDQEMQITAAHQIIQKKLSVRETEKLVKQILNPRKVREKKELDEQIALAYHNLEEQMQKKFGSKVSIRANGDKGKIEIEYYSQDDLERIIDMLS